MRGRRRPRSRPTAAFRPRSSTSPARWAPAEFLRLSRWRNLVALERSPAARGMPSLPGDPGGSMRFGILTRRPMPDIRSSRLRRAAHVLATAQGEEVVLLDTSRERYYTL